jgi:hypothetical protein
VAFQSWKRYILDPWEGHVFLLILFAAVTGHRSCEMSSIGMRLLEGAATDLEVSYSSTPSNNALHPKRSEDRKRVMCDRLTASSSQKTAGGGGFKGDVPDALTCSPRELGHTILLLTTRKQKKTIGTKYYLFDLIWHFMGLDSSSTGITVF